MIGYQRPSEPVNWDYLGCILERFFPGTAASKLTYRQFFRHLEQIPRLKKWEAGQNPDDMKALSTEDFIEKIKAGEITPDIYKPKLTPKTPEEKLALEEELKKLLFGPQVVQERIV